MKKIAITGGIASGKSTLCEWLRTRYHLPVFDADATVHRLYHHPLIIEAITLLYPACITSEATIDRRALARHISDHPDELDTLEDLFHPLVRRQETLFWQRCVRQGYALVFSDIPLLFETNSAYRYDAVMVADSPVWLRQRRAMQRPQMTQAKWRTIIRCQVDDATRRQGADFLIPTSIGKAHTAHALQSALSTLREVA
jgi:dephospho-CoA kinase